MTSAACATPSSTRRFLIARLPSAVSPRPWQLGWPSWNHVHQHPPKIPLCRWTSASKADQVCGLRGTIRYAVSLAIICRLRLTQVSESSRPCPHLRSIRNLEGELPGVSIASVQCGRARVAASPPAPRPPRRSLACPNITRRRLGGDRSGRAAAAGQPESAGSLSIPARLARHHGDGGWRRQATGRSA